MCAVHNNNSMPFAGEYDVYGTGGYIQDLPNNRDSVNDIINEINTYKWLDRRTRAVIIEFSVYNSNINLIASATYLVEFTVTGSVLANAFTQVFRPSLLTDATGGFSIVCYVAYLIALLITSVKTVQKLRDKRCAFFNEAWNCIDVLTCILSYSAIGVWVVRYIETSKALERYYNDKSGFINFSEIVTWDSVFNSIIGIVVFTAQLRILSALGYNKKMAEIVHVIRHAARDLLSFSVIYGIAFFGFVILGFLLFGSSISDYRDLLQASGSMVNTLIGRNSLDQMVVAGPYFAQFYFFCYVLFVVFILLTMFAAILNQSITAVRQDTGNEAMTIGLLDLIQGTLNDLLGTVGIHIRRNNRRSKHVSKKYQMSVIKKNAQIDAQNIIQLVRDTFGNFNENEPDIENTQTKTQKFINDFVVTKENEKYLIDISPETERISSACTPRDIDFGFAYPIRENSEPSVYNSF